MELMRETKNTKKINVHFKRQKNKTKMAAWIMRQYFDPSQHYDKPWYRPGVTSQNVLEHLSRSDSRFPLTPFELSDLWACVSYLQNALRNSREKKLEVKESKYQLGEITLTKIGNEIGDVSAALINRIIANSMEKIKTVSGGQSILDLNDSNLDDLNKKIADIRISAANEFAEKMLKHPSASSFIKALSKEGVIREIDQSFISESEKNIIDAMIMSLKKEEVEKELLFDIEKENNILKSFQYYASKKMYTRKKKGKYQV